MEPKLAYQHGLRPWIKWMPRPLLVAVLLFLLLPYVAFGALIGIGERVTETTNEWWRVMKQVVTNRIGR